MLESLTDALLWGVGGVVFVGVGIATVIVLAGIAAMVIEPFERWMRKRD